MSQAIDLHCHSTVSDGLLTPEELVLNAHRCGVKVLALTDHDDLGGLSIAREVAEAHDIHFINGVEISVTWKKRTLHIVGLKVDPKNEQLKKELAQVRLDRDQRALEIAEGLAKVGIHGAYEAAKAFAGEAILTRMHFAHFLVENGHAKNTKSVFKKYLVKGKPGFVDHQWMTLDKSVQLIRAAGGDAVIAHPGRYDLGIINTMMLMNEFKGYGGEAIEVVTGSHTPEHFEKYAKIAEKYTLKASRGSDFHGKGISFMEMGRLPALPSNCIPVWQNWPEVHAKIAQFV